MTSEHDTGAQPPLNRRRTDRNVVRVAAVGDIHCGEEDGGRYREQFARVNQEADVLVLAGDLTRHGTPAEMRVAAQELSEVRIPILAVLGNHDHESGMAEDCVRVLRDHGIHVLDGEPFQLDEQVGFVGVKGYMGGFGRYTLTAFGEGETKAFVGTALEQVQRLEFDLRRINAPTRVVVLHYAPVVDTVVGEPEQIMPFLGNDRLAEPVDRFGAAVVFHGHAHHGSFRGRTPGGVPVFNVSHAMVQREHAGALYFLYDLPRESAEAELVASGARESA